MKNSNSWPKAKIRSLPADEKPGGVDRPSTPDGGAARAEAAIGPLSRPADSASGLFARGGRNVPRHFTVEIR